MTEEYRKLLERLANGAEYLENPLIKPEDYAKGKALYDKIEQEIETMRRNET